MEFNNLSEIEKKLIEQAVELRALERQLDAPTLKKMLTTAAIYLEEARAEIATTRDEAEEAYDALEIIRDSRAPLHYRILNLITRYRNKHPKRIR